MKDVLKLKQTEFGFVEDENGVEYIRYSLVSSMQKSIIDENHKLRARINKLKTKHYEMRTIKFRWKQGEKFLYGDLVRNNQGKFAIVLMWNIGDMSVDCKDYEVDPDTIGQFTGLYDKNDKEIYEGDILLYRGDIKIEVKYHHGGFGYTYIDTDFLFGGNNNFHFHRNDKDDDFEVIGNIHDNKELLTQN